MSGLFGAAPRAPLLTLPPRNSRQVFPQAADDRPVWGEKVIQVAKLNWPRAWADGPYVPKWKTGRQRGAGRPDAAEKAEELSFSAVASENNALFEWDFRVRSKSVANNS